MTSPNDTPDASPSDEVKPVRRTGLTIDDVVVTMVVFFGFGGAVGLWIVYSPPSAVIAFLLAAGVSALVYRFLGGLQGSTFVFGAVKIAGTMGTLMAVFFVLNYYLDLQQNATARNLAGEWRSQYAEEGWAARIMFQGTSKKDEYGVYGAFRQFRPNRALFDITGGTAIRNKKGRLDLNLKVKDYLNDREVTWVTPEEGGLVPGTCFSGSFNVRDAKGIEIVDPSAWGIELGPVR